MFRLSTLQIVARTNQISLPVSVDKAKLFAGTQSSTQKKVINRDAESIACVCLKSVFYFIYSTNYAM